MMNDTIYQKVFDTIDPFLPKGWTDIVLYVGYTVGSYTMKYYVRDVDGKYTDCFSQNDISKSSLIKAFVKIDKLLTDERKQLDDKHKWSVFTLIVTNKGLMKAEFDYQDISKNAIQYENVWKEKYIK